MKKIALINDLSGFGRCSLTASIPVISAMGIQACPLPTAILSAQTGFADYYCDDYTDKMDLITDAWQTMNVHFDGIYSGYLASAAQIDRVLHFLDIFKTDSTLFLADPVLGDNGVPIKSFQQELLQGMRTLCAHADVCTPNLTELCLLTDTDYTEFATDTDSNFICHAADTARLLLNTNPRLTVVVTGMLRHYSDKTYMGNLAVNAADSFYIEAARTEKNFSGTGDLFASVICGALVKGKSIKEAMQLAHDFLQPAIRETAAAGTPGEHGIHFENYLSLLL